MEITIDIPDALIRKIKTLSSLVGGSSGDFEPMLLEMIDSGVSQRILNELGMGDAVVAIPPVIMRMPSQPRIEQPHASPHAYGQTGRDITGISDGLGDDDDHGDEDEQHAAPPPPKKQRRPRGAAKAEKAHKEAAKVAAKAGGLTEEALEKDMEIGDPDHEAKGEAPTFEDQMRESSGEELFAGVAGFSVDPRIAKRKKRLDSKAKVSNFDGNEESTI